MVKKLANDKEEVKVYFILISPLHSVHGQDGDRSEKGSEFDH